MHIKVNASQRFNDLHNNKLTKASTLQQHTSVVDITTASVTAHASSLLDKVFTAVLALGAVAAEATDDLTEKRTQVSIRVDIARKSGLDPCSPQDIFPEGLMPNDVSAKLSPVWEEVREAIVALGHIVSMWTDDGQV